MVRFSRSRSQESAAFARAPASPSPLRRALARLAAGPRSRAADTIARMAADDDAAAARDAHAAFYDYGTIGRLFVAGDSCPSLGSFRR